MTTPLRRERRALNGDPRGAPPLDLARSIGVGKVAGAGRGCVAARLCHVGHEMCVIRPAEPRAQDIQERRVGGAEDGEAGELFPLVVR